MGEPVIVEVGGNKYSIGRLNAFKQLHVSRKMMPVFLAIGRGAADQVELLEKLTASEPTESTAEEDRRAAPEIAKAATSMMQPMAEVLSRMSDEDVEYVIKECLMVVQRDVNGKWAPVMARGGQLMYQDLKGKNLMELTRAVIQENLGDFFPSGNEDG